MEHNSQVDEFRTMPEAPSVGGAYGIGWKILWPQLPILLLVWLVGNLIGSGVSIAFELIGEQANLSNVVILNLINMLYSGLVAAPISLGVYYISLRAVRGDEIRLSHLFEAFNNYGNVLLVLLLQGIFIMIGLVFLIVPGIIIAIKLSFTPFLLIDRKMKAWDAIQESWRMTKGHSPNIFFMYLLGIPIVIAGIIALLIGIIPATLWIGLAFAAYYHMVYPYHPDEGEELKQDEFAPIR